jgi:hypothetical protein
MTESTEPMLFRILLTKHPKRFVARLVSPD